MTANHKENLSLIEVDFSRNALPASENALEVCVVCCTSTPKVPETVKTLVGALSPNITVKALIFSETNCAHTDVNAVKIMPVNPGTKLSKLRLLAQMEASKFVCICDPDLCIEPNGCLKIVQIVLAEAYKGKEVVAFGLVEGTDDASLLSKLIVMDKWLSHRVIRRFLWRAKVGITLPGQFVVISWGLLNKLQTEVDSYLDDLYLGLIARKLGAQILYVPVVIGKEEPRSSWGSLITQRLRWMKGLSSLIFQHSRYPTAVALLSIHYFAYHGLPILIALLFIIMAIFNPVRSAISLFICAFIISKYSRISITTIISYFIVFPLLHLTATLLFWLPLNQSVLRRR